MKRLIIFILLMSCFSFGQDAKKPEVRFGFNYLYFYASKLNFVYYDDSMLFAPGFNLEYAIPWQSVKNTSFIFGAFFSEYSKTMNDYYNFFLEGDRDSDYGDWDSFEHIGGGLYTGLDIYMGGENFGVSTKICGGYFTFEQSYEIFEVIDKKSYVSSSLGALFSAGFYVRINRISIYPNYIFLFSGDNDGGLNTFSGGNLSIGIQL